MEEQKQEPLVIFSQISENLATFKLNRPKALNAMNQEMNTTFNSQLNSLTQETKFIIIEGEGRAFSVGADIKALYKQLQENKDNKQQAYEKIDEILHDEYSLYHNFAQKQNKNQFQSIAIMNGITMGGASGVSILGKYRIVTENTMYAMPETKIGFYCDVTSSMYYSQLRNNLGFYYGLTGKKLNGKEMFSVGLADFYMESKNISDFKNELITTSQNNKLNNETLLQIIQKFSLQLNEQDKQLPYDENEINLYFENNNYLQFKEKLNNSNTELAQEIKQSLQQQCPLSLRVVFELYKQGKSINDITQAFILDYKLAHWMIQQPEFYEGTRCVLVDKNDIPNYKYKNDLEIPEEIIQNMFTQEFPNLNIFINTLKSQK